MDTKPAILRWRRLGLLSNSVDKKARMRAFLSTDSRASPLPVSDDARDPLLEPLRTHTNSAVPVRAMTPFRIATKPSPQDRQCVSCWIYSAPLLKSSAVNNFPGVIYGTAVFGKTFFDTLACRMSTLWHRPQLTVLPDAGRRARPFRYLASSSLCLPSMRAFSTRWLAPVNSTMRPW